MRVSRSERVGRRGIEPRTRGLKDAPCAVQCHPVTSTAAGQRARAVRTRSPIGVRLHRGGCHRGCHS